MAPPPDQQSQIKSSLVASFWVWLPSRRKPHMPVECSAVSDRGSGSGGRRMGANRGGGCAGGGWGATVVDGRGVAGGGFAF